MTVRSTKGMPLLHVSASAIRTLRECPREFAYRYLLGLPRQDISPSMVLGQAVHRSLEVFYAALRDGSDEPGLDDMIRMATLSLSKSIVDDVPISFADGESVEVLVSEAERLIETFMRSPYRPRQVLDVEARFALAPIHPRSGELVARSEEMVFGILDLVCLDDEGELRIVDHKVSKRFAPPKSTARDVQMSIYGWAGDQLYGRPVKLFHQTIVRTKEPRVELREIPRALGDSAEAIESVWSGLELIQLAVVHPEPLRLLGRQRGWRCDGCGYRQRCSAADVSIGSPEARL